MSRTPGGIDLPWHRVVNAQGKIALPEDSRGHRMQRELLEQEGVDFLDGKIDLERYGYRGALDQLLWGDPG